MSCWTEKNGFLKEEEKPWNELKYDDVKKSVEEGDENAKTVLAWLMLSGLGGASIDDDSAVVLLEERVKDKNSDAMWLLGICNEFGRGTEQDIERAQSLYQQSKDNGNEIGAFFCDKKNKAARKSMEMNSLCLKLYIYGLYIYIEILYIYSFRFPKFRKDFTGGTFGTS